MRNVVLAGLLAGLLGACGNSISDTRKGPLFCDEAPQPKRYLTDEEAAALGDDWIDIAVTLLVRGKSKCGWDYQVPEKKGK